MSDIDKLKRKLAYHQSQVHKIQTALEVLSTIDDIDEAIEHSKDIEPKNGTAIGSVPKEFDASWTHNQKIIFFLNKLGRCAIPREIELLYKNYGQDVKGTNVNQFLITLKGKRLLSSYKPDFPTRAFAWGLPEWFHSNGKPKDEFKAKPIKGGLFD